MVVDKCVGRCLDVGSIPTGSIVKYGRLLKRLKRLCWKRSRRVKACVGSNPMSSVIFIRRPLAFFVDLKGLEFFADWVAKSKMGLLFRLSDTQKKDGFVSIFLFL